MRPSRSYWKRTSGALFAGLIVSSCAAFRSPEAVSLTGKGQKHSYETVLSTQGQKSIFKTFCGGSRQVKAMKFSLAFVLPKNPQGRPVDLVSNSQAAGEVGRKCLARELLYQLSGAESHMVVFVSSSEDIEKVIEDAKSVELFVGEYSNVRVEPTFVTAGNSARIVGFYDRVTSRADGGNDRSTKYAGSLHRKAFLVELNALVRGFTIIEPARFQEEAYRSLEAKSCGTTRLERELIAVNGDGSADLAGVIDQRGAIWRRYVIGHSTIKESMSRDPQIVDMEISLDLNDFCRYGRHVEDLNSH